MIVCTPIEGTAPGGASAEQIRVRREKLDRIRAQGIDPYPVTYPRTHTMAQVTADAGTLPPGTSTGRQVAVAGRVILKRDLGRLGFAKLRDGSGDLQLMVDQAAVGQEQYDFWRHDIDLGDQVGVTGEVITTRRGELSVRAESLQLTSKALRPLLRIAGEPLFSRVYRWERASAQHEVGHLDRMAAIDRALVRHPGLFVTGSGFRGVGIPDCVADGRATARAVAAFLGSSVESSYP